MVTFTSDASNEFRGFSLRAVLEISKSHFDWSIESIHKNRSQNLERYEAASQITFLTDNSGSAKVKGCWHSRNDYKSGRLLASVKRPSIFWLLNCQFLDFEAPFQKSLNFDNGGSTEPFGEIWIITINAGHKIKLSMTDSYLGQNSRSRFLKSATSITNFYDLFVWLTFMSYKL